MPEVLGNESCIPQFQGITGDQLTSLPINFQAKGNGNKWQD